MYKVVVAFTLLLVATGQAARPEPPKIIEPVGNVWSPAIIYVRNSKPLEKHCRAKGGDKEPTIKWTLNGVEVGKLTGDATSCNNALKVKPDGTLSVSEAFSNSCNGYYQCIAENDSGKSMTPYLSLNTTDLASWGGGTKIENEPYSAYTYKYFECKNVPASTPPYRISWIKTTYPEGKERKEEVKNSERIVIDPQGTLHFLWLLPGDDKSELRCKGTNDIALQSSDSIEKYIMNLESDTMIERPLQDVYAKHVTAMRGTNAQLVCIFSYFSQKKKLKVKWERGGEEVKTGKQYKIFESGRVLEVQNVQFPSNAGSVEGEYVCKAKLEGDNHEVAVRVNLTVVGPPVFTPAGNLIDFTAPVGVNAEFRCKTYSHKSYSKPVTWLQNGEPIVGCVRPKDFECNAPQADGSSECLSRSQQCDSVGHCADDSDELNCPVPCSENEKSCDQKCIPKDEKCDEKPCQWPSFKCADGSSCIGKNMKCDGRFDCKDRSDEKACSRNGDRNIGRFTLSGDRSTLTLNNINMQDNMCIQCMVENEFGTLFGEGCLTVIGKTVVTSKPESSYIMKPGDVLNIGVDATTDSLMQQQLKYTWYWHTNQEPYYQELPYTEKYYRGVFKLSQRGKNLTIVMPDIVETEKETYIRYRNISNRRYFVKIGHKYENVTVNFTIQGIEVFPPVEEPTVQSAGGDLWWLAIIIGVIFLIVIVVVIFCLCYRNRGGVYLLDKKEQKAGHDPEQELKDSGFHDVGRVGDDEYDDEKPRADEVSLTESVKPYDSDEDITEEYGGDFDVDKFNEDGSFIGMYVDKKKQPKEATV